MGSSVFVLPHYCDSKDLFALFLIMPLRAVIKTHLKKKPGQGVAKEKPPRMTAEEKRLVREMRHDRHMCPQDIADALGRNKSSITRCLAQKRPVKMGRPVALSPKQIAQLVKLVDKMVEDADADYEVTLPMVHRRSRLKCSERTISRALRSQGYRFFALYEKMILTPGDIKERWDWSKKYKDKPRSWWHRRIHMHVDNKHFKAPLTIRGRRYVAKRRVRGAYRPKNKPKGVTTIKSCYVKPPKKLQVNLGTKGILKMGGVGGGKVLVWETIDGRWTGDKAAELYKDVVKLALSKRYPGRSKHTILEDNDPTGNMSKKGVAAKKACKIEVFKIPPRSPDLNVLDYTIWATVEKLMRKQERNMKEKHETRQQFINRLDRTAKGLSAAFINNAIDNLKERCQRLHKAKGGLFQEGGRKKRPL